MFFNRTRAQRTGRAQTSMFFPVLDPGPVSSPSRLIHLDFFEPFGGAISGSCGFYAFKEFLQSRELFLTPLCMSPTGDLWQCVLSMHLLLTVAFVTNQSLSGLKDAVVPPAPESFLYNTCWPMQSHQREFFLNCLVTGISVYDREGYYLGHFKSVTTLICTSPFHHSCFPRAGALETFGMILWPAGQMTYFKNLWRHLLVSFLIPYISH